MATRWGILGCGSIAGRFAEGLKSAADATLAVVGSRSQEKADAFGEKWGAGKAVGSYEALVSDPNVDVIYVATPHPMHVTDSMLALNAGKAVLCEKPFTVNRKEAEKVVALAREKKLFLMEGHWSRFFPAMVKVRELLKSGAIGEPLMMQADFGFRAGVNPEGRLFNLTLAGGGLLDVGCYPIALASMVFGKPDQIAGVAHLGETGVDELAAMSLRYPGGKVAALTTACRANTPQEAWVLGSEGNLKISAPWWNAKQIIVKSETHDIPFEGNGFNYEAVHVGECLAAGKTESDIMPLNETLDIMETMDTLRAQWGLKYPME